MITTHVLDTAQGRPAIGVPVELEIREGATWRAIAHGATDADGRVRTLLPAGTKPPAGTYRLRFDTATYLGATAFFPEVTVVFQLRDPAAHYHVPLLLAPYGYSTYRGT